MQIKDVEMLNTSPTVIQNRIHFHKGGIIYANHDQTYAI